MLLLALGARRREIGFVQPIRGTGWASVACLMVPALFIIWAFASGRTNWTVLGLIVLHSFLSNGSIGLHTANGQQRFANTREIEFSFYIVVMR